MCTGHSWIPLCWISWFLFLFTSPDIPVDAVDVKTLLSSRTTVVKKYSARALRTGLKRFSNDVSTISRENENQVLVAEKKGILREKNFVLSMQVPRTLKLHDQRSKKMMLEKGVKGEERDEGAKGKEKGGMKKSKDMTKKKGNAPSPAPVVGPTVAPSGVSPVPTPIQTVLLIDFYISFVAPDATREPTQDEYDEMFRRITAYFKDFFTRIYAKGTDTEFLDVVSSLGSTLFGDAAGTPRPDFNIYMNFEFSNFTFSKESVVPTNPEIFQVMLGAISIDLIVDVIRTFSGSPFESTNEIFFAES